jgi:pSer/pThr/pTyr-binding forkhead associated (FHA) protein
MKVVLELLDQPSNIRKITVRHDIVIGRGADCNLRLSAPQISRRHCFLRVGRDTVSVTDLDSSNGTYLSGKRIESGKRFDVFDGVTLALGPIRFVVSVRTEKVSSDVLQVQTTDDSINLQPPVPRESGSTVIDMDSQKVAGTSQPMNYSIEHVGPSADENEPTADLAEGVTDDALMDSEAEIVDLGRRIAEFESNRRQSSLNPMNSDQQFSTQPDSGDGVQIPDDLELLDDSVRNIDDNGDN